MNKIKFADYLKEGISNKYETIMLSSRRVVDLNNGSSSFFDDSNHKNTVKALEEVEKEFVDISELRERLISSLQEFFVDKELQENYNLEEDTEFQVDLINSDYLEELLSEEEE